MWGADSIGVVLAFWLAGRVGVWSKWSGRARAALYVTAYGYGRMLFSATQDWNHQHGRDGRPVSTGEYVPFRWPGAYLDDYARPALDLLTVFVLVWLLLPIFKLCRGALAEKPPESKNAGSFSLAFLFGWLTAASVVLLWVRFLTWEGIAPSTAYTSMNPTDALTEFMVEYVPELLIVIAAVMLLVVAWSGRWWLPVIVPVVALLIDGFGHELLYIVLAQIRGSESVGGNVLTGDPIEQWSYLFGRNLTAWIAFGIARAMGVSFHKASIASREGSSGL